VTIEAVAGNLAVVRRRIDEAARTAGRDPRSVELIAVAKGHDAAAIQAALEAGHRQFGENRVQEAGKKWPRILAALPDVRLHLIGPLQTNKVREALALFDVIETIDRPRLAEAIHRERRPDHRLRECFVQVNTGEEPQKAGVAPADAEGFIRRCREDWQLPVTGLMCIPPVDEEPSLHFALLADLARRAGLTKLSMGMSADYEIAVAFGATEVRVGTMVFGHRAIVP